MQTGFGGIYAKRLTAAAAVMLVFVVTLAVAQRRASGVEGTGRQVGNAVHITKQMNSPPPCANQSIDYTGAGLIEVKQGRITYSGTATLKYFVPNGWANPTGSIKPYSDDVKTACGDGTAASPAPDNPQYGPSIVERASLEGSNTEGFSIKCTWGAGTFERVGTSETLIFDPGTSFPVEGAPGTCTIKPPVGQPRTSNTKAVSEGRQVACEGFPAPVACQHDYQTVWTTHPPVPPEPPPVVSSVTVNSLPQGTSERSLAIAGEEYDTAANVAFSGEGITVHSTKWERFTALTTVISIANDAPVGARDVTVVNADGTSGTCSGCFNVTPGVPSPAAEKPPAESLAPGGAIIPSGPSVNPGTAGLGAGSLNPVTTNAPPPPAPPSSAGPGGPPPGTPGSPGTPGGTGFAPSTSFVPSAVTMHSPAAVMAATTEEASESAPEAGARVMMVGRGNTPPQEAYAASTQGAYPALALAVIGVLMLFGCSVEWYRHRRRAAPGNCGGDAGRAYAFATASGGCNT